MNELPELLYEIAMAIEPGLDLKKTIHEALMVYMKRLNCVAGAVLLKETSGFSRFILKPFFNIPANIMHSNQFENIERELPEEFDLNSYQKYILSLPRTGTTEIGTFFTIMSLPGEGVLVLFRNSEAFDEMLLRNLKRLNQKLSYSISASKKENEINCSHYRYRELILSLPQAFYETDIEGKILFLNRAGKTTLGIDHILSEHDITIKMFLPYHVWEGLTGKTINSDGDSFYPNGTEVILQKLDGSKIPALLYVNPVFEESLHTGFRFFVIDITERKQTENIISNMNEILEKQVKERTVELNETIATLKQTQNQLVHSEKMVSIGQLAAGVAHEINNPTGFVMNNLSVLKEYIETIKTVFDHISQTRTILENNNQDEIMQHIKKCITLSDENEIEFIINDLASLCDESLDGTKRIKDIVLNLRNFARQDEDSMKPADINKGIDDAINLVWNKLKYKCTLEKDFASLPQINCNINQLEQVFVNLLVNAADAMKESGVIAIRTFQQEDRIIAEFKDTGSGIPEENMKSLFDPFFTTKEVGKGTGLGLSISHGIVETHKGEIEVNSELGKGSVFKVILPIE